MWRMSNLYLLYPELLLLLVPLVSFYFWRFRSKGVGGITRLLILATLALLAAIPLAPQGGKGVDVVVIADLSKSMPVDTRSRELEIINLLEKRRGSGGRRATASASSHMAATRVSNDCPRNSARRVHSFRKWMPMAAISEARSVL